MSEITLRVIQQWAALNKLFVVITPDGDVTVGNDPANLHMTFTPENFVEAVIGSATMNVDGDAGVTLNAPGYESLAKVLHRAFNQATTGKGAERHARGQPFDEQPMQQLCALYGPGFALGQAGKKMQEAQRLPMASGIRELLGAINYTAGAIVYMENHPDG